jgi:hypothetical protein
MLIGPEAAPAKLLKVVSLRLDCAVAALPTSILIDCPGVDPPILMGPEELRAISNSFRNELGNVSFLNLHFHASIRTPKFLMVFKIFSPSLTV